MKSPLLVALLSTAVLATSALAADTHNFNPLASAPAAAASAAGTWKLEVQTSGGVGTPTFTFKQDGETLTGQYQGLFGEAPVTGTLKGADIVFTFKVNARGQDRTFTYSGTIEGDTIKGKATVDDFELGSFTGKRSN